MNNRNFPDYSKPFSINGMEIDLHELEIYEKKLAERRRTKSNDLTAVETTTTVKQTERTIDEIDEYLDRLVLDLRTKDDARSTTIDQSIVHLKNAIPTESNRSVSNQCELTQTTDNNVAAIDDSSSNATQISSKTSFPLLLYGLLSIFAFVNSVCCKNAFETNYQNHRDDLTIKPTFFFSLSLCIFFFLFIHFVCQTFSFK